MLFFIPLFSLFSTSNVNCTNEDKTDSSASNSTNIQCDSKECYEFATLSYLSNNKKILSNLCKIAIK